MLRNASRTHLIGALAAAIAAVAVAGCGGDGSTPSTTATEATPAETMRTVLVFNQEPSSPSPSPTDLHAGLEKGALPGESVVGTVLTDEDCAPDAEGISHCRNAVRLPGGATVVLRHPHEMHMVPCLAPGEKVLLRRA